MSAALDEQVTISLPKGTLLVLFEFLSHSYELWKRSGNPSPAEDTFVLFKPEAGERAALWHLEGAIERTLPEIFAANYNDLVGEWKQKLTAEGQSVLTSVANSYSGSNPHNGCTLQHPDFLQ